MGFVLGGLVSGIGKGLDAGYDAYHQNALEKIRQAAEDKKTTADQAIKLAGIGYRPLSDAEQATMSAPPRPKISMLDPESRAGLSQNGIATDNGDGSMTVPDGRPTAVSSFGGHPYAFDPSRMIDLKGGIAEAQYTPKATAQAHNIQARGDIQKLISGDRNLTQRDIATGHDATKLTTTGMNVDQRTAANKLTTTTSHDNNVRNNTTKMQIHQTPNAGGKGGSGGSSTQDVEGARAIVADAEANLTAYEDKVQANHTTIPTATRILANSALFGDPKNPLTSVYEAALNKADSDLAGYVRSMKQFAVGQRMTMARGGSNSVMNIDAILSGAGAGADSSGIARARAYRKAAMAGKLHSGSTPSSSDTAPSQDAAPTGKPSLQDRVQQLKQQGLSKDAVRQQVLHEGYSL